MNDMFANESLRGGQHVKIAVAESYRKIAAH